MLRKKPGENRLRRQCQHRSEKGCRKSLRAHLCFTMTQIHPHSIIGGFVREYDTVIYPLLTRGDVATAVPAILNAADRMREIWEIPKMIALCGNGSYENYCLAVQELRGLMEMDGLSPETLELLVACIDRRVSNLDLALGSDPTYKSHKESKRTTSDS